MKKIIITIMAILVLGTASYAEKPYVKFGVSQLKTDYKTIGGINYSQVYEDKFDVYTLTGGYEFNNNVFVEARYFWTSEEGKSGTVDGVAGSTKVEMDGYSIGAGYNFKVNDKFSVKPSIHYVEVDVDATLTAFGASFDTSGTDQTLDAGVELAYSITEKSSISINYNRFLDDINTAENAELIGISYKHSF